MEMPFDLLPENLDFDVQLKTPRFKTNVMWLTTLLESISVLLETSLIV